LLSRRTLVLGLGFAFCAVARASFAQHADKIWRVGFLSARSRPDSLDKDYYGAFPQRMRELGYVDGKNLSIEWRFANGEYEKLSGFAHELVGLNVDVILALGAPGALAAQKATTTIPIVVVVGVDPVAAGLVKSLAQPGGNVTGLSNLGLDLGEKHLELLRAIVPRLSQVAVLVNSDNTTHGTLVQNLRVASQKLDIRILPVPARTPRDIDNGFSQISRENAGAVIVGLDPFFIQQASQIAAQATKHRLPSVFAFREAAEAGGLLSYGQNQVDIYRRAAGYVDKILRGAKPRDLPVEQPTTLELFVNRKTATALGLSIPHSLLISADKVIE